ncbi:DUF5643 domain-containing protein [Bacillus sp. Hm123]|uniref:DUF5643 domain-containing protein n=1 Tax=Bacillus sp. Hm123 TaxID=3450745 RepID=UPI003F44243C
MTTVIHYEQFVEEDVLKKWPHVSVVFDTVQDNLGNDYIAEDNGGTSRDNLLSFQGSSTIKAIDPNAKSLTIVPTIIFSLGSGKGVEEKKMEPIKIDLQ